MIHCIHLFHPFARLFQTEPFEYGLDQVLVLHVQLVLEHLLVHSFAHFPSLGIPAFSEDFASLFDEGWIQHFLELIASLLCVKDLLPLALVLFQVRVMVHDRGLFGPYPSCVPVFVF